MESEGACAVYSEDLRYMYMARPVQDPRMKTSDWHPGGQVSDLDDGQKEVLRDQCTCTYCEISE